MVRNPRRRRIVTGAVCATAIVGGMGLNLAGAADPSLKERIESARSDAGQLNDRISSQGARIAELTEEARQAGARAMELNAEVERAEDRSRQLTTQLIDAERRLDQARAEYGVAVDTLEKRLVTIYKSEAPDYVDVLLSSDGFDDLSTRSDYLQALHDADMRIAERVDSLRDEVAGQYHEIADLKREVEAEAARLDAARADFEESVVAAEQGIAAVAAARSETQSDLSSVEGQIAEAAPLYAGGPYAIPTYIVMCESGGNYRALNPSTMAGGAYQIIPSTWHAYGGGGYAHQAPKAEQDRIAAAIWRDSGPSAWSCA
jgi:peptidoglycan hydrolase CwlO-like protein